MSGAGLGRALCGYNAELLEGLAELRARREELSGRIREEEAERNRLQAQIGALTAKLLRVSESLAQHLNKRGQLDRMIADTEAAHGKILEALPDDLKREIGDAQKASESENTSKGKEQEAKSIPKLV